MSTSKKRTPPRIYCIPATDAPIVAVFTRGPADWSHVGRWDVADGRYEPGAWLRGRIFPRRSDVSPDGRLLCYFAHKPTARWRHGDAYVAISKLPWLSALHAFGTCGTWTRGYHFSEGNDGAPGVDGRLPIPYGLQPTRAVQFECERRRGWHESADCPTRDPADTWDERRNARIEKRQPGGARLLIVESLGRAGGEFGRGQAIDGLRVCYSLRAASETQTLHQLQWADWDRDGMLLVATRSGKLQVWDLDHGRDGSAPLFDVDLSVLEPNRTRAPDWARRW